MSVMDYHDQFRRAAAELGVPQHESARFADLLRFRIRAGDQPDGVRAGTVRRRRRARYQGMSSTGLTTRPEVVSAQAVAMSANG